MTKEELVTLALDARKKSYAPYSRHLVGAALLTKSGKVYTGCNIENAGFTPTNCAERTALFKAVSDGEREFVSIAVVGGMADAEHLPVCAPCGVCRQVLREFCDPEVFTVILGTDRPEETRTMKLAELLPLSFGPDSLL